MIIRTRPCRDEFIKGIVRGRISIGNVTHQYKGVATRSIIRYQLPPAALLLVHDLHVEYEWSSVDEYTVRASAYDYAATCCSNCCQHRSVCLPFRASFQNRQLLNATSASQAVSFFQKFRMRDGFFSFIRVKFFIFHTLTNNFLVKKIFPSNFHSLREPGSKVKIFEPSPRERHNREN